jgi:hypothetical protein
MLNFSFVSIILVFLASNAFANDEFVLVKGRVSDFANQPIVKATIEFQDELHTALAVAESDAEGNFSITLKKRSYTIFAVKDYKVKYLEYWHWNYQPNHMKSLDIKIDGIEMYGMKAWSTATGYPGLMVFVRPMSLGRWKELGSPGSDQIPSEGTLAITPELDLSGVTALLDDRPLKLRGVNLVREYITDKFYLHAYLIHVDPGADVSRTDIVRGSLCLIVNDPKQNEFGKGCVDL